MRRGAFTLLELLVVIAVIAVLAAMLVPAIGVARELARGSVCRGNLRQVALGVLAYAQENDGFLPPPVFPREPWIWSLAIGERLGCAPAQADRTRWSSQRQRPPDAALGVFACPSAVATGPTASLYLFDGGTWGDVGINAWGCHARSSTGNAPTHFVMAWNTGEASDQSMVFDASNRCPDRHRSSWRRKASIGRKAVAAHATLPVGLGAIAARPSSSFRFAAMAQVCQRGILVRTAPV